MSPWKQVLVRCAIAAVLSSFWCFMSGDGSQWITLFALTLLAVASGTAERFHELALRGTVASLVVVVANLLLSERPPHTR